jgi:hypothetical protein
LTIWVLCATDGVMMILAQFVVMMIIVKFDTFVAKSVPVLDLKNFITDAFGTGDIDRVMKIRFTTSSKCGRHEKTTRLNGEPAHMRVFFKDRPCYNKMLFVIYKIYRVFYVAFYFYYAYTVSLIFLFLFPYLARKGVFKNIFDDGSFQGNP